MRLNPPEDWQAFERLCRDLLGRIFSDPHSDLNGRSGQAQAGVDVVVIDRTTGARVRVQCKNLKGVGPLDEILIRDLVAEVSATPSPPDRYVILTTAQNDASTKALADALSQPGFEVQVHGWDWMSSQLQTCPDLIRRYGLAYVMGSADSAFVSAVARGIGDRCGSAWKRDPVSGVIGVE